MYRVGVVSPRIRMGYIQGGSPILTLPNELLLDIFNRLPRLDQTSVLRVSSDFHSIAARKFCVTLATRSCFSVVYSGHLKRLRYTVTSPTESFLTYPVLCQALLTANGLVALALDLYPGQTEPLLLCFQRYGLTRRTDLTASVLLDKHRGNHRPSSVPTLPALRGLKIRGDPSVAALVLHRPIEELVFSTSLDYNTLSELCCNIVLGGRGHVLSTLVVRLGANLVAADVVEALAEVLPNLEQLSIDQVGLQPMSVLNQVVSPWHLFPKIRRLTLNVLSGWRGDTDESVNFFETDMAVWLADHVRDSRLYQYYMRYCAGYRPTS
ncbi:hypothetical protein C8R43DRAFT_956109 [Mycena crocata]|nr:hypothetical protein C8R43DRAFT_956109 [Mycena crocata]